MREAAESGIMSEVAQHELDMVLLLQQVPPVDALPIAYLEDGGLCLFTCAVTCSSSKVGIDP